MIVAYFTFRNGREQSKFFCESHADAQVFVESKRGTKNPIVTLESFPARKTCAGVNCRRVFEPGKEDVHAWQHRSYCSSDCMRYHLKIGTVCAPRELHPFPL